jgi:hypothetical protein
VTAELAIRDVVRGRGRPSNADLAEDLGRARAVNMSLREQLHVERRASIELAELVRETVVALHRGRILERDDILEQATNAIGYAAARHLHQRSGGAL